MMAGVEHKVSCTVVFRDDDTSPGVDCGIIETIEVLIGTNRDYEMSTRSL